MRASDAKALEDFDELPGSARVRLPVVASLFSVSAATVWRWCASGRLPKPVKVGGVTLWSVSELRAALQRATSGDLAQPGDRQ